MRLWLADPIRVRQPSQVSFFVEIRNIYFLGKRSASFIYKQKEESNDRA